jgi:CheY-like chemotaxis protein
MPVMNGLDLCQAIRAAPGLESTRIVLISSKWTLSRRQEAERLRVDARLDKPIDGSLLARLVSAWLM